jgi:hypothetical protein
MTANDISLYKKIDDILYYDWDPIDIKNSAPRDEYEGYVPQIFNLTKTGADRLTIANKLLQFETEYMGVDGSLENCLMIADKIVAVKHYQSQNEN